MLPTDPSAHRNRPKSIGPSLSRSSLTPFLGRQFYRIKTLASSALLLSCFLIWARSICGSNICLKRAWTRFFNLKLYSFSWARICKVDVVANIIGRTILSKTLTITILLTNAAIKPPTGGKTQTQFLVEHPPARPQQTKGSPGLSNGFHHENIDNARQPYFGIPF